MAGLFKAVLEISVSACVLILLTLGARLIIGRKPGIILPLLSVLILVRLAVPVNIPSPLSVQNLFTGIQLGQPVAETVAIPQEPVVSLASETVTGISEIPSEHSAATVNNEISTESKSQSKAFNLSFMDVCALVWIAGMVLMSACVVVSNLRFSRLLRKNRAYDAPGFDELLGQCKDELGIQRNIDAVQVSEVNTAAVYGVFRPRLLISPCFGWLPEDEKRHVLLHELSHIKRCDTVVALLMTILNIVHWFNPFVWAALALARKDIETMCDLAVLRRTEDRLGYARTLLSLAKTTRNTSPRLAAALFMWRTRSGQIGVLVSTYSIKRRIKMIARYKKSPALTALALVLVIALAVTGCTAAVTHDSVPTPDTPANTETAQAEETVSPDNTEFVLPEIEGQVLISSCSLDFSSIAGDEARVANIKKAAEMLDGTVLPCWKETLTQSEDFARQINIPEVLGLITEEMGWRTAAFIGWYSILNNIHEEGPVNPVGFNAYYTESAGESLPMEAGGGIELAAITAYSASQFAGLDGGSCSIGPEDIALYEAGELSDKYTECPKDSVNTGGIGMVNNNYASDVILRMWVQGDHLIVAFYSDGPIKPANIPVDWQSVDVQSAEPQNSMETE